jgi:hypothetical protein
MAAPTIEGRRLALILLGIALAVSAGFAVLSLLNIDKIRTSVAVRRSEKPVLKTEAGEMVIVPAGEFQVPAGEAAPPLKAFYIDKRGAPVGAPPCEARGMRPVTPQELAKAARGATPEKDVSIYGVEGLAAGRGGRCAMDAPAR